MKNLLLKMWRETDGVLSFEWTVLTSLLTVGVVSGVSAVRDSTVDEFGDIAQAMLSLDQSYFIEAPLVIGVHTSYGYGYGGGTFTSGAVSSGFRDALTYQDCQRGNVKVQEFDWKATGPQGPNGAPSVQDATQ